MPQTAHSPCKETCEPPARWALLLNDRMVVAPDKIVRVSVLRHQGGVPADHVVIRDHNSPNDVVFEDAQQLNLAEGNVFYTLPRCDVQPRGECRDDAKLAFFVNDQPELTTRSDQTGRSIRDLFNLPTHALLQRDLESPRDIAIKLDDLVRFEDGPVFNSRQADAVLTITVNSRVFTERDGVQPSMWGLQIAALVFPEQPAETSVRLLSEGNRPLALDEVIAIRSCQVFEVVRKEVTGGYESSRIDRELAQLLAGGQNTTFLGSPTNAVVYHGLPVAPGESISTTDVLVPIPGGYPGQMLDGAYLPETSPLMHRVKGEPQNQRMEALGQSWRRISYHPHQGGGAPGWNPTVHGFHTYRGELTSWLNNLR